MGGSIDFKKILRSFLPRGLAWSGQAFDQLVKGLSQEFKRVNDLAQAFLEREIPGDLELRIGEWERVLAIPDGLQFFRSDQLRQRNNAVVGSLSAVGGQDLFFWRAFLRRIGSDEIDIRLFQPLRAGDPAESLVYDEQWVFVFEIFNIKPDDLPVVQANVERSKQAHIAVRYELQGG